MPKRLGSLLFVIVLTACSAPEFQATAEDSDGSENSKHTEPAGFLDSTLKNQSKEFDLFARGELSVDESKRLVTSCKANPKANPFCFSIVRAKLLKPRADRRFRVRPAPEVKEPETVTLKFSKGKLQNWSKLRRAKVPVLLKAFSTLTLQQLKTISARAQREKYCPNNIAVATAATFEDYLPNLSLLEPIGQLYERAAQCAKRNSADRDHLLTRSGLFHYTRHGYKDAERVLAKVKPHDAYSGRALYWLARTRDKRGNKKGAERARAAVLSRHRLSFHAALLDPDKPLETYSGPPATKNSRSSIVQSLIRQGEILTENGYTELASVLYEWAFDKTPRGEAGVQRYLLEKLDAPGKVQLASGWLLRRGGLSKEVLSYAYPRPYTDSFTRTPLDPLFLYAFARKESQFNPRAISPANAQGLIQILPSTADRLEAGSSARLLDPAKNIEIAAKYLTFLMERFRGQHALAIAAYNAGEDPVERWLARYPTQDPILFIDLIPYRETRDYVGYVYTNYHWYYRTYAEGKKWPLASLGPIEVALGN